VADKEKEESKVEEKEKEEVDSEDYIESSDTDRNFDEPRTAGTSPKEELYHLKNPRSAGTAIPKEDMYKPFPNVYMDIKVNGKELGKIVINLFDDTPITSENFRSLCTGERTSASTKKKLTYKGSTFHRCIQDFLIQGGDIISRNGQGGESIYGNYFCDENFWHRHDKRYLLAMANCGEKDTNSS
jgi:hypothetical protein